MNMKNNGYGSGFCAVYDKLNSDIDTKEWAQFVEQCISKFSDIKVKSICELACGTASLAIELFGRGYAITALDLSEDMLCEAEAKSRRANANIRFTHQDMSSFSLYSKTDMILCLLDSVNYLESKQAVSNMLNRVYNYLNDGGIFVFDVNSKYKFENIYGCNAYVLQDDGVYCGWENYYSKNTKKCHFYLSVFTQNNDGSYNRFDEVQTEYMYTQKTLVKLCEQSGFSLCGVFGGFDFEKADENSCERLYFVIKKKK